MNQITFKTDDGEIFKVDLDVARKSQTIRDMMDSLGIEQDSTNEEAIPLPNKEITGKFFQKLVFLNLL